VVVLINTLLLDLGGTLVELNPAMKDRILEDRITKLQGYILERNPELKISRIQRIYEEVSETAREICERQSVEIPFREVLKQILNRLGLEEQDSVALFNLERELFRLEVESWRLRGDAYPALETLHGMGLKMGIVSNARSEWAVREIVRNTGIARFFHAVITSAQVGYRKPRPEIFQVALELLEAQAERSVMVGNDMRADIMGAKEAGIKTILIGNKNEIPCSAFQPDSIIDSLLEIPATIKKW
jgi:putative hydrolase of the HAD superfamily